jgi:phage-related protein
MHKPRLRPLIWVGGSKKDYEGFPAGLRHDFGFCLYRIQLGDSVPEEKMLSGGVLKGLGIRELIEDDHGDTYRVVYTVNLRAGVYVLHAFKKKSKSGIATPRHDVELIRSRYALARKLDDDAASAL